MRVLTCVWICRYIVYGRKPFGKETEREGEATEDGAES